MNPAGSGQKCLTSNHPLLSNKHIGQPAWHPSGNQIMGLVIPHRPDTRKRGSGIIVLIDLPTR
jgi:hypothetical protein